MSMSRRATRQQQLMQTRKALSLLALSGAIRPADVEPRYFGAYETISKPVMPLDRGNGTVLSFWHADVRLLVRVYMGKGIFTKGLRTSPTRQQVA